jgi:hypothetical protein
LDVARSDARHPLAGQQHDPARSTTRAGAPLS